MLSRKYFQMVLVILMFGFFMSIAEASDLIVGAMAEPSIDPHFLYVGTNTAYAKHLFGSLVDMDENMKLMPSLSTSWNAVDATTWEFKLRRGVKFHDGSDFTAEDVAFSIWRIPNLPNSPNPYTPTVRSIVGTEVVDPHTIRFRTNKTNPYLPNQLVNAIIISKKAADGKSTADFTSGKAAIGTGPFKFVKYTPADRLILSRNEDYWGEKPLWDRVIFRIIRDDGARVAALLAGDVDMIDYVPPADVAHLEKNPKVRVFKRTSNRIIYFCLDVRRDKPLFITDKEGRPLEKNPLKDLRVRKAISMAINRDAICKHVMEGLASPASQLIPEGFATYNSNIKVEKFKPTQAKKLLAEAGYPNGFGLTIHGPNDRYVNDAKICQAVGQMLAQIGLSIKVDTMPKGVFFPKITAPSGELSFFLVGIGTLTGDSSWNLTSLLHTYDKARGVGGFNQGGYSNPELDRLLDQANSTIDDSQREKLLQRAMEIAVNDLGVIPLHAQFTMLATRKGLITSVRSDELTLVMGVKQAP